jgi:hypothetical protein
VSTIETTQAAFGRLFYFRHKDELYSGSPLAMTVS